MKVTIKVKDLLSNISLKQSNQYQTSTNLKWLPFSFFIIKIKKINNNGKVIKLIKKSCMEVRKRTNIPKIKVLYKVVFYFVLILSMLFVETIQN